jgi:hypothetical protein
MRSWIWMAVTALTLLVLGSGCGNKETPPEQKIEPGKDAPPPIQGGKGRKMPPLPP